MKVFIPIEKETLLEVIMGDVDDILMNMREEIFNQLQNSDVSGILLETQFSYFDNSEKEKKNHNIIVYENP